MTRKKQIGSAMAQEVRGWFLRSVMYEGGPYTIDLEQAEAVADESKNAIVVARAGSGKTRTIVAKMTYLIAKCGVRPEELMAFVFNANAAAEINARLSKMLVDGIPITEKATVASTFHAFARKIVYDVCDGREKCKQILADDKEGYMLEIVKGMVREAKWRKKITEFLRGEVANGEVEKASGRVGVGEGITSGADEKELERFAKMMALFVNRAQQKYLGGDVTLGKEARRYLKGEEIERRERLFIELGVECHRRYHWYLLSDKSTTGRFGRGDYGTDFNLIVSWAAKLIAAGKGGVRELLSEKKIHFD